MNKIPQQHNTPRRVHFRVHPKIYLGYQSRITLRGQVVTMGDSDPERMNMGSRSRTSGWNGDDTRRGLRLLCIWEDMPTNSWIVSRFGGILTFLDREGHF